MNKKGEIDEKLYLYLFYILLAIIVGVILTLFILNIKDDTRFKMKKEAINNAFLLDTISISKENIEVQSTSKNIDYLITFSQKPCLIKVAKSDKLNYVSYRCFNNYDYPEKEIQTPFLELNKKDGEISIK